MSWNMWHAFHRNHISIQFELDSALRVYVQYCILIVILTINCKSFTQYQQIISRRKKLPTHIEWLSFFWHIHNAHRKIELIRWNYSMKYITWTYNLHILHMHISPRNCYSFYVSTNCKPFLCAFKPSHVVLQSTTNWPFDHYQAHLTKVNERHFHSWDVWLVENTLDIIHFCTHSIQWHSFQL